MNRGKIAAQVCELWPPLAWVAKPDPQGGLQLWHGADVEVHEDWFGEVAWDGRFGEASFDQAEHVSGSGARFRNGNWRFVSATSVLDRLHSTTTANGAYVSNSLCGLCGVLNWSPQDTRTNYPKLFTSICRGIDHYQKSIPMAEGSIELTYFRNLQFNDGRFIEVAKPYRHRQIACFEQYRDCMHELLETLADNWKSAARAFPFTPLASLSTGYDSPAVSTLALAAGLRETISIVQGRSGESDDGSQIAATLGLHCQRVEREQWRRLDQIEPLFLASDGKGEDVYFAGAAEQLKRRVLLTGYGGTRVWGMKKETDDDFRRGDQSGLSHTEARLHFGYLHLPVPFLLAQQPDDLRRISSDPAMRPWHVESSYNCPIARRIVEDAGVPRESFGMTKKAASILLFDRKSFLSEASKNDFERWYEDTFTQPQKCSQQVQRVQRRIMGRLAGSLQRGCQFVATQVKLPLVGRVARSSRLREWSVYEPHFRHLFPWAARRIIRRYQSTMG